MKLPFELNLEGKCAVVTGAGGVLCSDFAKAIAKCGASVALLDINLEAAEAVAKDIREMDCVHSRCYIKSSLQTTGNQMFLIKFKEL